MVHLVSQDLSIAGKREGLAGERSGLFMEQIRIIKELRDESRRTGQSTIWPRYMVWENVPGCFSSNKGEDFRAVLEETAKICDENAVISGPPNGKWPPAGSIVADGWSIAWRVHDAQYWGCAQRRKRVCVLADFNGQSAWLLLFELQRKTAQSDNSQTQPNLGKECGQTIQNISNSLSGNSEQSDQIGETITGNSIQSARTTVIGFNRERCGAVTMEEGCPTIQAAAGESGNNQPMVCISEPVLLANNQRMAEVSQTGICNTLPASMGMGGGYVPMICQPEPVLLESSKQHAAINIDGVSTTLMASMGTGGCNVPMVTDQVEYQSVVRKLTERECEILQGYPVNWTSIGEWTDSEGKRHKESASARYKALGNSIALPFWDWLAKRMCNFLRNSGYDNLTMASLFDGIGGFPYVFQKNGCKPLWASEIEEFPIAVTKIRFPEGEDNDTGTSD